MAHILTFKELEPFLDRKRKELLDVLSSFGPANRRFTEYEGGWTISEIVEHLCMIEGVVIQKVEELLVSEASKPAEPTEEKIADVMGLFTAKGLIGTKKQAPPNALPVNKVPYDEGIARLDALRMDLKAFLPRLAIRETNSLIAAHPLGVDLNVCQWVHFSAVHEWAHINQVKRIREANRM